MASCVLCGDVINLDLTDYAKLTEKGCIGINNASKERQLDIPAIVYSADRDMLVHKSCRSKHNNPKAIKAAAKRDSSPGLGAKSLRSQVQEYDFKTHCLFCGIYVDQQLASKYPERLALQYSSVQTLELQDTVKSCCIQRQDEWAAAVKSRILSVHDLPAAEAIYHKVCSRYFRSGNNIPLEYQPDVQVDDNPKKPKLQC